MSRMHAGTASARFKPRGPQVQTIYNQMNLPEALRPELSFLAEVKDRTGFMDVVARFHQRDSEGYILVTRAYDEAEAAYGDDRRHSGEREFKHSVRCTLMLMLFRRVVDPHRIAAMLVHDLHEKRRRRWSLKRIAKVFGATVALHVRYLSKEARRKGVSKHENERRYYVTLATAPADVIEEKGIDVLDNLLTLWKRSTKRMLQKLDDVVRYMLPLLRRHGLTSLRKAIQMVLELIRHKLHNGIGFAH